MSTSSVSDSVLSSSLLACSNGGSGDNCGVIVSGCVSCSSETSDFTSSLAAALCERKRLSKYCASSPSSSQLEDAMVGQSEANCRGHQMLQVKNLEPFREECVHLR